ncbi:MAG: proline dioxygenase [Rhizobacter sp.]|nr:proline dioxygenase [Rhizobacter sp.]
MSHQQITPQLRQWIVEQAAAGHSPESVLAAMLKSGWSQEVAVAALEETVSGHLQEHAREHSLPPPEVVPEPAMEGAPSTLWAGDREVRILATLRKPRVIVFGGLLSDEECDELVALAKERLARSQTVDVATGGTEVNEARSSEGMFFGRGENPLCERIEARIAALLDWPLENGEGLQILKYGPGAEYKPHYDYFDPAQSGTPVILKRGGQRVATLVMYLCTPPKGGATVFPDVHFDVAPIKGNAVFFSYDRPHPMTQTLHGGAPVVEGEKWVATKWLRVGRFE